MKKRYMLFAILVTVMLIQLDVKQAVDHPETSNLSSGGLVGTGDPLRVLRKVMADTPAPRTPTDVKQLVLDLLEATPLANRTDRDGDGLYDPVETIIGTDLESNDTDADGLSDYHEVMNGTDPILPDSNYDGLFDYDEVNIELDLDDDGIPNAWDFDNDGDGVNDRADLSPYAESVVSTSFNFSIQTTGSPTYITFQVLPQNPEHLRLLYQTWDWPDYDTEGQMQDLDGSKDDLELVPYLHLKTEAVPVQSDLDAFGVLETGDGVSIPLSPVYEFENIVAFNGRLLYAETTPLDIDLEAELVWQVLGYNDVTATILKADGNYVSVGRDMIAVANASDEGDAVVLEWITIRETSERTTAAIRIMDGPYLSVAEDKKTLEFTGTSIGERETFQLLKLQGWLMGYNENCTAVLPDGTMVLRYDDRAVFEVMHSLHTSLTPLVKYTEPFMFTGFTVEEFHGADVGILYNVTDKNQTIAAQWLMNYRFVNNATTTLSDMPGLLQENNVAVSCQSQSVSSKYEALVVLSEELIPSALYLDSGDEAVPIIIAIEDNATIVDMSEAIPGSYILGGPCTVDMATKAMQTSKSLKMNWYNSTTFIGLSATEIIAEVITWGEDPVTSYNLVTILLRWNTGEYKITKQDLVPLELDDFDPLELELAWNIAITGVSALELGGKLVSLLKNWRHLKWLQGGEVPATMAEITDYLARWSQGAWGKSNLVKSIGKNSKILAFCKYQDSLSLGCRSGRFAKFFKMFNDALFVIGIVVEIGLSIAAGVMIADQIGGSAGKEFGTAYAVLALIVGLWMMGTLAVIAAIPVIGWLLALGIGIADACGDYSQGMITYVVGELYGEAHAFGFVTPDAYVREIPTISVLDSDSNGVDLGDTILVNGTLWSELDVAIKYVSKMTKYFGTDLNTLLDRMTNPATGNLRDLNYILPYVDIIAPAGSDTAASNSRNWLSAYLSGTLPALQSESGTYKDTIYEEGLYTPWYHYWFAREYSYSAWIRPGIAQPDFPVVTRMTSDYKVSNFWWHSPVWKFGAECLHREWSKNYTQYNIITGYYDVFPGSLADFLEWKSISPNDYDGDGFNETEETAFGTFWTEYDSDADGLDDGYEIEQGYNPLSYDTDFDGVTDWFEHAYGTNVTNSDSDGDGLDDYQEISGWVISFSYLGNISLPFQMPVASNPNNNDTDEDGIGDLTEYQSNTNPRSNDTNADGEPDLSYAQFVSEAAYETYTDWTMEGEYSRIADICVDEYGHVYASGTLDPISTNSTIRKYDSSLVQVTLPSDSVFINMTCFPSYYGVGFLRVDEANDWLYAEVYTQLWRFDLNGTSTNPGPWTPLSDNTIMDVDFDVSGNIYAARFDPGLETAGVRKYSSDGTVLATWGTRGSAIDQYDELQAIAVDDKYGFIYLCDQQWNYGKTDRVVKLRLSDGAYVGTLSQDYDSVLDVDVDVDGCVYVLGETPDGTSVQKFYPNGDEDEAFRFFGNETRDFMASSGYYRHLAVAPDKSIYVLDWIVLGMTTTSRIWKFSQTVTLASESLPDTNPDWDNDGLNNTQEVDGWNITVNFAHGEETFRVASSPVMNDSDQDGLGDLMEFTLGSDPGSPDTDLDGVSDHKEWWLFTYPGVVYVPPTPSFAIPSSTLPTNYMNWRAEGPSLTNWDTDGDLLRDGIELAFGSSPVNPDLDGDGLSDVIEFLYNSNPNSNDTDSDGADDGQELAGNSSLLSADSDNDFIFDGAEYYLGTNPTGTDFDADGIPDGYELLYGTDPLIGDCDDDGIADGMELTLWLDPWSNDTDGDGVDDGTELSVGSSPWNEDSDYDGVPDGEDSDTLAEWEGPIILVMEPDASNDTLEFATMLGNYVEVIVVSVDELVGNYGDSPYIVLVGRPDPDSSSVAGLMYDLLADTGDTLTDMMAEGSHGVALRYGVWTDTQTVAMLSSAVPEDAFIVLQIMRWKNVTVLPEFVRIEYQRVEAEYNGTIAYAVVVNEIDSLRAIDSFVTFYLSGAARLSMQIAKYNATTTPHVLTYATGLHGSDVSLGVYLEVSLALYKNRTDVFESALLQVYYKESDLDQNGDGVIGGIGDIDETSICLYWYDDSSDSWIRLTNDLEWVLDASLNTTDAEIYGENYAGYVWANVTRLSLFGLAGELISVEVPLAYYAVAIIAASAAVVGVLFVHRRKIQNPKRAETEVSLGSPPGG